MYTPMRAWLGSPIVDRNVPIIPPKKLYKTVNMYLKSLTILIYIYKLVSLILLRD